MNEQPDFSQQITAALPGVPLTEEQRDNLVTLMQRAERAGHDRAKMASLVREVRAGPLRAEAARYNPTGNITFSLVFDNDLMAALGQSSAQFFARFINETLNIDQDVGARELLQRAAELFRFYEKSHRDKVAGFEAELARRPDGDYIDYVRDDLEAKIADTIEKAERNAAIAAEIEEFLA